MIPFGLGGVALMAAGAITGMVTAWNEHRWITDHALLTALGVLVALVAVFGLSALTAGRSDPTRVARDCREVYELLGATGPQGEIMPLPPLTARRFEDLDRRLSQFGEQGSDADEVCRRLREDLDSRTDGPSGRSNSPTSKTARESLIAVDRRDTVPGDGETAGRRESDGRPTNSGIHIAKGQSRPS